MAKVRTNWSFRFFQFSSVVYDGEDLRDPRCGASVASVMSPTPPMLLMT